MCIVSGSALNSGKCTCPVTLYASVEYFMEELWLHVHALTSHRHT